MSGAGTRMELLTFRLEAALYATEELEETAKLFLLLRGAAVRALTQEQVAELRKRFG